LIDAPAEFGHSGSLSTCSLPPLSRIELRHPNFVQRTAVLSLDARAPVHEHVIQQESLIVEEANLELLDGALPTRFRYARGSASTLARQALM
jgi:hypothetical protein